MTLFELFVVYPALMLWWAVILGACVALLRAVIAGKKPDQAPLTAEQRRILDKVANAQPARPSIWKHES